MDQKLIRQLNQINLDFYNQIAQEFSNSRQFAWAGWSKIWPVILLDKNFPQTILDLGCGNGRFFKAVQAQAANFPAVQFHYLGLDTNEQLLHIARQNYPETSATFQQYDLLSNQPIPGKYDLIVAFGILHHIPGLANRQTLLQKLAQQLQPGGYLVISFWQFLREERYQKRLIPWSQVELDATQLESDDYLLDWRNGPQSIRYCHFASDEEIESLLRKLDLQLVSKYRADGKNQTNRYVILRKV